MRWIVTETVHYVYRVDGVYSSSEAIRKVREAKDNEGSGAADEVEYPGLFEAVADPDEG